MGWKNLMDELLAVQLIVLAVILTSIYFLGVEASRYYLFELLGVVAASTITVYGLIKMREMT